MRFEGDDGRLGQGSENVVADIARNALEAERMVRFDIEFLVVGHLLIGNEAVTQRVGLYQIGKLAADLGEAIPLKGKKMGKVIQLARALTQAGDEVVDVRVSYRQQDGQHGGDVLRRQQQDQLGDGSVIVDFDITSQLKHKPSRGDVDRDFAMQALDDLVEIKVGDGSELPHLTKVAERMGVWCHRFGSRLAQL